MVAPQDVHDTYDSVVGLGFEVMLDKKVRVRGRHRVTGRATGGDGLGMHLFWDFEV